MKRTLGERLCEAMRAVRDKRGPQLIAAERARLMSAFGSWLNLHRGETVIRNDLELFTPAEREWMDSCIEDIKRRTRVDFAPEMRALTEAQERIAKLEAELAASARVFSMFTGK